MLQRLLARWLFALLRREIEAALVKLFASREAARSFAVTHYGYIRTRRDLRAEPHGWRKPAPVRVTVRA